MTIGRKLAPLALLLLTVGACAAGSAASHQAAQGGAPSEIVLGFWHGLIGPITLLGEIINKVAPHVLPWTVHFYETQNTDALYDVGFFVGLLAGPSVLWTGAARRGGSAR